LALAQIRRVPQTAAAVPDEDVMIPALDTRRTAAYLAQLGVARDQVTTDLPDLTLLHERHLRTIPFENLVLSLRSTPNGPRAGRADRARCRRPGRQADGPPARRVLLRAQRSLRRVARVLSDFAAGCRYHQTSPDSHFTQQTVCSLATATGRVTISGRTLITTVDGNRTERAISSDDELLDLYDRHFGIALDRVPEAAGPAAP
jgi:arylamine N-acetyltransferase